VKKNCLFREEIKRLTWNAANNVYGMFDLKPIDKMVQVGNGHIVKATIEQR
jgi:hypothetical protein